MAVDPQSYAAALKYGPQIGGSIRRSQYLAAALKGMQEDSRNIKSAPELGVRLLANALLSRKADAADRTVLEGLQGQRQSQIVSALAGLGGGQSPSMAAPPAQDIPPPPPPAAMAPATASSAAPDTDALFKALIQQESGGRPGALGPMTKYGQAQGMTQMLPATAQEMARKVGVPWQPELMTGATPDAAAYQERLGRAYLTEGLEKYGGDPRQALMFYHGGPNQKIWGPKTRGYADQVLARVPPPQPVDQAVLPPAAPYQVASLGQTPGPPSAAAPSPQAAGAPPAVASPAAGGTPFQRVTQQEIDLAKRLLEDPNTFDQGQAFAMELQKRQAAAVKYDTGNINGVPTWTNPYAPGEVITGGVPQAAMTRPGLAAQGDGSNLVPGTSFDQTPTGNRNIVQAPPAGFQGVGGSGGAVRQGPQDPAYGQNLISGERQLREEYAGQIKDYSEARKGYEKVVAAANDGTPASDIALIFGFMKTLDPTSTVREGEYATAQNSGSVPENIMRAYNGAIKGDKLLPEKRAEFAQTALNQYKVYEQKAQHANERFGGMAAEYGYKPDRIVQPITPVPMPNAPKAAPSPAAPNQQQRLEALIAERERRRRGGK